MPLSSPTTSTYTVSDRNLALELVRVTEAAAIQSFSWIGRGKKNEADNAAVEGMRHAFDTVAISGTVVIGEGEMDEAPMLYIGEKVGSGGPKMDIAVDPLEGTNLTAKNLPNAITVVALAEEGKFLHAPDIYMDKIAIGPDYPEGIIDIDNSIETNLRNLAKAKKVDVSEITLSALDRDRHQEMIARAREVGVRVKLLSDGDVAGIIATCIPDSNVDIFIGSGGAPEGVLAAAALRCFDGQMQGRLLFEDQSQIDRAKTMSEGDPQRKLFLEDMASGNVLFSATGVTTGDILKGVQWRGNYVWTNSLVTRSRSKTVRFVNARHNILAKPMDIK
ncbi:class II fructose-bisphosphatase [Commensalibacter nepenthis]|uniref:Fructose-1,6-bisphosphatase n=1 Tax=Commensalibacter nepenthis TaxID=3043872 RepID=A0ABT6Q9L1_9PROT|nr:class II fructose-bisphosphatase [Commensalibacter sp. TBRC 10068]MDI2112995.1 class II fructose-bisphosphatase [Commensalibacter sp. TBRC 10068]